MDRQRIDKWLWHARVVRTRPAAAALIQAGLVRINGARTTSASHPVRIDDVVLVALDRGVRVLKVTGYSDRRGSASESAGLFEELTPAAGPRPTEPGAGPHRSGSDCSF